MNDEHWQNFLDAWRWKCAEVGVAFEFPGAFTVLRANWTLLTGPQAPLAAYVDGQESSSKDDEIAMLRARLAELER